MLPDTIHLLPQELSHGNESEQIYPLAIERDDGLLLVDPGLAHNIETLEQELEDTGHSLDDVSQVLLTHQDPDHAGAAATVVGRSGATVLASIDDAPAIDGRQGPLKGGEERYDPVTVDIELTDGARIQTRAGPVQVIATPGHTPGHISLYLPEHDLLLAGDALNVEDGLVGPRDRFTPDMEQATASLARLTERSLTRIHCFHGGPVDADTAAIEAVLDELRDEIAGHRIVHGSGPRFLRRELDADTVGLSRFEVPAGDRHGAPENPNGAHRHTRQQELYLINEGQGRIHLDGETIEVEAGDAVLVQPHVFRAFEATEDMELFAAGAPVQDDGASMRSDVWD